MSRDWQPTAMGQYSNVVCWKNTFFLKNLSIFVLSINNFWTPNVWMFQVFQISQKKENDSSLILTYLFQFQIIFHSLCLLSWTIRKLCENMWIINLFILKNLLQLNILKIHFCTDVLSLHLHLILLSVINIEIHVSVH